MKNNITKQQLFEILNKDAEEMFLILNTPSTKVVPLIKTFDEEMLEDLIKVDKRNKIILECTSRLRYLTRTADLDYLIKQFLKGKMEKQDVMNRLNMSEKVLDCAIDIYQSVDRKGRAGIKKQKNEVLSINKRLHNVSWKRKINFELHWYIPMNMYETIK